MRIATIGSNFIVDRFLNAAAKCHGIEHIAIYSRTEERGRTFAQKYGVQRIYTDLEEMADAPDIDGVYIASPNYCHCQQAILMMQHGKHVLCEKPVASNHRELEAMLQASVENRVVLLEAMRSLFDPGFLAIQEQLPKLGKIRRASFQYCQYSSRYDRFKAGIVENAFNFRLANGALMDIGVYCVAPLIWLFGMPKKFWSDCIFLENGVDGAGTIIAGYPGMQAELLYSKISDSKISSQIQGENATMVIQEIQDPKEIRIHYRNGEIETLIVEKDSNNLVYEIQKWVAFVETGLSAEIYNHISCLTIQLMDQVRQQLGIVFPADSEPTEDFGHIDYCNK